MVVQVFGKFRCAVLVAEGPSVFAIPAKNEISFSTSTFTHNVQHPPRGLLSFLISTILDLKMAP